MDGLGEVAHGLLAEVLAVQADPAVVVAVGVAGLDRQGARVVVDCAVDLAHFVVGEPTIEIGFEVLGVQLEGFGVELDCAFEVLPLAGLPTLAMEHFGLSDLL